MSSRITSNIMPWIGGRWRAEILVDGYIVEKSFHHSYEQAAAWCADKRTELAAEVR